jgi:EAL domain-containing protein (putative c-di-GMP-specific phosphodiesterase class I)
VRIVKIDKSFVAGSTENPEDRAVTEAVVKMAAQMGLQTIAEGVETLDQQRLMEAIGADGVQGFLHLRPVTAEKFGAWLGEHIAGLPASRPASDVVTSIRSRRTA